MEAPGRGTPAPVGRGPHVVVPWWLREKGEPNYPFGGVYLSALRGGFHGTELCSLCLVGRQIVNRHFFSLKRNDYNRPKQNFAVCALIERLFLSVSHNLFIQWAECPN